MTKELSGRTPHISQKIRKEESTKVRDEKAYDLLWKQEWETIEADIARLEERIEISGYAGEWLWLCSLVWAPARTW